MNWAWGLSLPPTQKLLLLALADNADDAGACWPSLKSLATKCEVTPRTIQRAIKEFEACGLLAVTSRYAGNGRQTSNAYRLILTGYPVKMSPPTSAHCGGDDKLSPYPLVRRGERDTDDAPGMTPSCQGEGDRVSSSLEPPTESPLNAPPQPPALRWPVLDAEQCNSIEGLLSGMDRTAQQLLLDELGTVMSGPGQRIRTTPARYMTGLVKRYALGTFIPTSLPPEQPRSRTASHADSQQVNFCRPSDAVKHRLARLSKSLKENRDPVMKSKEQG